MLGFILGSMFGGSVGVAAMCLCSAAKWGDEGDSGSDIPSARTDAKKPTAKPR